MEFLFSGTQITGYLAGLGTTVSFLPQVLSVVRTKSTEGVSPMMFVIHTTGVILWVVYGVMIQNYIIVGYNVISCMLCSVILCYIVRDMTTTHIDQEEPTSSV